MILSTKSITMYTVALALFMDVLDSNIINTAIPVMAKSLQVHPIDLKIALISYLLSLAVFIPISGWTADKYGTKRVFIYALGLFTFSSFYCGYAHTLLDLVIARSVQGIGGSFMISLGRLIIARTFERHQLVEAMNAVIIVVSIAVMIGPFIGGVITQHLSWPWIFWVNIPTGILAIALAAYGIKDTAPKKPRSFDALGFVLFGGSLAIMCFSLSQMSESNVNTHITWLMMGVAILMFVIFVFHAMKHRHPVINIELLRYRTFRISVFGNLFARLGFGGVPFLLPLLQQIGLGFSAQLSGLLLMPIAFGIIFSKLMAYRILRRVGYKRFLTVNTFFVAMILSLFQIIDVHTSIYTIASLTFIFGIFMAGQYTAMNSLAFAEINQDELSDSTSITSTVQMLAQTLGVAISAILLRYFASSLTHPFLLTPSIFHKTFIAMSVITFISILIFTRLHSNDGQKLLIKQSKTY